MNHLEKTEMDQLSRLLQGGINISKEISDISGVDKVTTTLVTVGLTLTVAGLLRGLNG